MALVDTVWYCNAGDQSTTGHYAVTKWAASTAVAAGVLRRQLAAPTVGNERVFVCIVAGTTGGTEPAWVLTRGAKTTDSTVTWMEVTGQAGLNGDLTNTATWAQVKAATPAVLGQVIKRSNNASYQICTTAGAMSASEPTFSDTAGVTTTDTTAVWTSLGVVGSRTGGQAPFARLVAATTTTWFAASNTVYVGANHVESQTTTMTISPAGSSSTIGKVICHNQSGSYPPASGDVTTGAVISTTAVNSIQFTPASSMYLCGLTFRVGIGQSSTCDFNLNVNGLFTVCENCSFELANTNSSSQMGIASVGMNVVTTWKNCTVKFGNVAQTVTIGIGQLLWQNTGQILVSGSSVPTNLVKITSGQYVNMVCEALDLSQISGNLFLVQASTSQITALFKDCKLHATTATGALTPNTGNVVQFVRCDTGTAAYKSARYNYEGAETTETTIVRTGGATDPAGQTQSRKIVTTALAQWLRPFKAEPYAVWNATTGTSVTATIYGVGSSLPLNDEIWAEFEYLSSASNTLGATVTTTKSNVVATGASVASDGSTWGGGTTPFKLSTTFTPGLAGYVHARIRVAKASATYYIDPQVYLS